MLKFFIKFQQSHSTRYAFVFLCYLLYYTRRLGGPETFNQQTLRHQAECIRHIFNQKEGNVMQFTCSKQLTINIPCHALSIRNGLVWPQLIIGVYARHTLMV